MVLNFDMEEHFFDSPNDGERYSLDCMYDVHGKCENRMIKVCSYS